tara:strand:+ start:380 stop:664 length:285 start_codon:yes stop_codon:yes gene_type:complete
MEVQVLIQFFQVLHQQVAVDQKQALELMVVQVQVVMIIQVDLVILHQSAHLKVMMEEMELEDLHMELVAVAVLELQVVMVQRVELVVRVVQVHF